MNKRYVPFLFVIFIFINTGKLSAQLTVSTAMTPAQMVQNVLVGTGVTVTNVTYSGVAGSIGTFTTGTTATNLGFSSGIIMSTGLVNGSPAIGSAASNFASTSNNGVGDPDLATLASATTHDAAVLQFDFIPLSDTIKFRYVFGSEEYPEFVNAGFNDVFGFFITGSNPLGGNYTNLNIAKIPGTALPVSIDNVNSGSYSQFYTDNTNGTSIVYDGFTKVLTAWCRVTPCMPYHLKLAISDAGDFIYDSGVFLEANSFSATSVTMNTTFSSPSASASNAIEGCNNATITFSLPHPAITPFPVSWSIAGTAINGVDYTSIPNSILIPAGQTSGSITISPILDGITEGTETVMLIVETSVCGSTDTLIINIQNNNILTAIASNDTTICGGTAHLSVNHVGGTAPYTYLWDNGLGTTTSVNASPSVTTTYHVSITDICGTIATDSVTVTVAGTFADAGHDTSVCIGQSANLTAFGGTTFLWSTGESTASITVTPAVTTNYFVTVTDLCNDYDTVTVIVNPLPIVAAIASPPSVINGASSSICGSGASTYTWVSAPLDPTLAGQVTTACPTVTPTATTNYTVTGIDTNGCVNSASVSVIVIPIYPVVDFWGDSLTGCQPLKVYFHDNSTKTVPGSIYHWDFGDGTHSYLRDPVAYYAEPGKYTVTLTVTNPGTLSSTMTIQDYVEVYARPDAAISTSPEHMTDILDPSFFFYDSSTGSPTQWLWDFGDGTFDNKQNTYHTFSQDDFYLNYHLMEDTGFKIVKLTASTEHDCSDTALYRVLIKPTYGIFIPNAFTPNNDGKNQDFCIKGFGLVRETYLLVIYDRWGNEVFSSADIDECWDGNIRGKKAEQGTYVYKVIFTDTMGTKRQKVGNVTLIR